MALPLLLPFAAPLLSASIPALAGMGAIGTGLLAGGLGAAEAAARGMEDPLQRGIMAGLTGGAAAGIGNALSTAGQAAAQTTAGAAGAAGTAPLALSPSQFAAADAANLAGQGLGRGQIAQTMAAGGTNVPLGTGVPSQFADMGRGLKALGQPGAFSEGGVGAQFLKDVKMPAIAGAAGLTGQSALAQEEAARSAAEERRREGERDYNYSRNIIGDIAARSPNSMVGRAFNNPYMPKSYFAEGGVVGLAAGGPLNLQEYNDYQRLMRTDHEGYGATDRRTLMRYEERLRENPEVSTSVTPGVGSYLGGLSAPPGTTTTPKPTTPSPAEVAQKAQYQNFLAQLQRGAGNAAASAASGYTGLSPTTDLSNYVEQENQLAQGGYLDGGRVAGDGMSDSVPATIDGQQPAALSSGEFVIPADVVSHLGNGSSDSGAKQLYSMMDRIRRARTGQQQQATQVSPQRYMPA